MTTPAPDPSGSTPPASDDSPTSPVDAPSYTAGAPAAQTAPPPPAGPPVDAAPAPAPAAASVPVAGPGPAESARVNNQAALVAGIVLVIVGAVVLVSRIADVTLGPDAWPLWIIVPGVAMLVASFAIPARGGLGLAIPGSIVTMVGLILWVQSTYDAYATWAYAWALVAPTAPGIGMMLYGLARGDRELAGDGARTTAVGLALFAGFALFFEGVLGLSGEPIANLDEILPYGLIGLGILLVILAFVAPRARRTPRAH
jgi:hypothetical protein